jgi:uncharacterized SAM-binding protein YcdF (DUF218 family)
MKRRMAHGIRMLRQGRGRHLLVTGGLGKHAPPEAHVMRRLALDAGVPATQILVEDQAISTFWSALHCMQIMGQHGWSTALIVTDRYHLPRSLWTFRCLGRRWGVRVIGSAVQGHPASRRRWRRWQWYARELCAWVWYVGQINLWKASHRR